MSLRRTQAQALFDRYFVPGNMTVAIVGDVTIADVKRLAERYFGVMPAKPLPRAISSQEPPQAGPKTVVVEMTSPPTAIIGYKRPSQLDKDDLALDLIQILLSQGRTALLYTELVQEKHLATEARAIATYPDGRFSNMFVFQITPSPGHTVEENRRALEELLQRFKTTTIDPVSLSRAQQQGRANLIRRMSSSRELAGLLAQHAAGYGDWRRLFRALDDLPRLTPQDVLRAASRYFVANGRTVVYGVPPGQSDAPPASAPARTAGGLQ
jgi:predicted Zn-dependent peptidase